MDIDTTFTEFPFLTTDRLSLRLIEPGDAETLFAIYSDEEAMQYYGHEIHRSLDETRELISQIQRHYARYEAIRWGIMLKGESSLIGTCNLHRFNKDFHYSETGYDLQRRYWGKGIMFEAMTAVLNYGFSELGLHRVEAIIDDANARSKGLLLKLGFTYEGNLRQRYFISGRYEDEHFFGLLKDEWQGLK